MAPQVLHRVCHGSSSPSNAIFATHNLQITPAMLRDFQRHRVRHADYPAIIPDAGSEVRGTLVTGLTDADLWRLDIFEGDEYQRQPVRVRPLPAAGEDREDRQERLRNEVEAETYVWIAGKGRLEEREWDFDEFRREKMRNWVGKTGAGEYADVDQAVAAAGEEDATGGRGRNGVISEKLEEERWRGDEILKNAV